MTIGFESDLQTSIESAASSRVSTFQVLDRLIYPLDVNYCQQGDGLLNCFVQYSPRPLCENFRFMRNAYGLKGEVEE